MVLPAPSGSRTGVLPAPTSGMMPGLAPAPGFGLTADDQALQSFIPQLQQTPTFVGTPGLAAGYGQQSAAQAQFLSQLTGGGVSSDPRSWTAETAAAQTDRALARIGQVNPELAQQLQSQRTGEQPEDGGGFLHSLLNAAGTVLHATGLSEVFDLLGRPAHIIPELLADEEHDSFWENIGQALGGHSDKGWGQVLDKYGIATGDDLFSKVVHNGLALIGDIGTDPLTYITFGAGGVSREILGETASKLTAKAFIEGDEVASAYLARAATTWGVDSDTAFARVWENIIKGNPLEEGTDFMKVLQQRLDILAPDARVAMGHVMFKEGEREAMAQALKVADNVTRHVTSEGAGSIGRMSEELAGKLGVDKGAVLRELEQTRKAGLGFVDKTAYEQAKAASALSGGGLRFRMSLPVFNLRYASNALPFTSKMNFQVGRRFFAGLSGYERLAKMVASGDSGAGLDHLVAFWNDGFSGLQKFSQAQGDNVAMRLANGSFLHGGSVLYPLSDAVGGFTAHFAPHAALLRGGGIGELVAANAYRTANSKRAAISDAVLSVTRDDGTQMTPQEVQREYLRTFGSETSPEVWDNVQAYMQLMPTDEAQKLGAAGYYDTLIRQTIQDGTLADGSLSQQAEARLAELRHKQGLAVAAEDSLKAHSDTALEGVALHRKVVGNAREVLLRHGVYDPVMSTSVDAAHVIHPEDNRAYAAGGHEVTADGAEYTFNDPTVLDMESGRIGEDQLTDRGSTHVARGWHLDEVEEGPPHGVIDEPIDLHIGHGERVYESGDDEWDKYLFGSTNEDVAHTYAGATGTVERRSLKAGSRVLEESDPHFQVIYRAVTGKEYDPDFVYEAAQNGTLGKIADAARDMGYDAVRMNDQDNLGTAVLNQAALDEGFSGADDPLAALQAALNDSVAIENQRTAQREGQDILAKSRAANGTDWAEETLRGAEGDIDLHIEDPSTLSGSATKIRPGEKLPPVPDGKVRIFRGGDANGSSWTTGQAGAEDYAKRGQAGSDIYYRDVSPSELPEWRGAGPKPSVYGDINPDDAVIPVKQAEDELEALKTQLDDKRLLTEDAAAKDTGAQYDLADEVSALEQKVAEAQDTLRISKAAEAQAAEGAPSSEAVEAAVAQTVVDGYLETLRRTGHRAADDATTAAGTADNPLSAAREAVFEVGRKPGASLEDQAHNKALRRWADEGVWNVDVLGKQKDFFRYHKVPRDVRDLLTGKAKMAPKALGTDATVAVTGARSKVDELLAGKAAKEAEIKAAQERSRQGVRLLNPIVRDLRAKGTAATEEIDLYAEAEKQANSILDAWEQTGGFASEVEGVDSQLSEEIDAIVKGAVNRDEKVGEVVTALLRQQGKDGIVTIDEAGRKHVTVFFDEGGPQPVKFLAKDAPRAADQETGQLIHQLTPTIVDMVRGNLDDRGLGASDEFLRALSRRLVGKSLAQAEKEARAFLDARGIKVPPGVRVFETDPLKIASRLANDVGGQVTNKYLGKTARRIDLFGLARSPFRGDAVGVEKFRYVVRGEEGLRKVAPKVAEARARTEKLQRRLPQLREAASEASLQAERLRQRMTESLAAAEQLFTKRSGSWTPEQLRAFKALGINPDEIKGAGVIPTFHFEAPDRAAQASWERKIDAARQEGRLTDLGNGVLRVDTSVKGYGTAATYYKMVDGRPVSYRAVSSAYGPNEVLNGAVSTGTMAAHQRQGYGSELLDAHWREAGVFEADDPVAAAARLVGQQNFSPDGAKLNRNAMARLLDQAPDDHPIVAMAAKARAEQEKTMSRLNEAQAELNKAQAQLETKAADVKVALVPAENAANMAGFEQLKIPGLSDLSMPSFMAQEFYHAARPFKNLEGFHQHYRQFMGWWKSWATYMFPGFHARNFMGAWFNNWLGGVDLSDYIFASRMRRASHELLTGGNKWRDIKIVDKDPQVLRELGLDRVMTKDALSQLTYSDLAQLTSDIGINSAHGRAFAEARVGTEHLEESLGKKTLFEKVPVIGTPYVKGAKGAGTMTENLFRTAAWVRGMRNTGGDIWGARAFTMMRHGDYQDLTDWEYGWVRDMVPFYKWMRTNTPFQIHQLFESPGKLLAVKKAQNAVFGAEGLDWSKEQYKEPAWMRDNIQVPFLGRDGAFNAVMLDLPMNDLFKSTREYISGFLPLVRPMLETYILKQSIFTGKPIGSKAVPLSPWFDPVAPLLEAVGLGKRDAEGNITVSEGTQNMLNAVPIFSRFSNWAYEDPSRVNLRMNTIASSVFGLGVRPVDQQSMISSELDFYYSQVEPQVEYLRSLGYPLPTTQDLEQTVGDTNTVLAGLGIDPGGVTTATAA